MTAAALDIYVAPWEQTRWLVASSFLFAVPSAYGLYHRLYSHAILLLLTSLVSANYWRKATLSWRRDMDLVLSKTAFLIFLGNGIVYVHTPVYTVTGYTGLLFIFYTYYLSGKYLTAKDPGWYKYHMVFHCILTYEMSIILQSIVQYRCQVIQHY
jgi:hypothetical protein